MMLLMLSFAPRGLIKRQILISRPGMGLDSQFSNQLPGAAGAAGPSLQLTLRGVRVGGTEISSEGATEHGEQG